MRLTQALKDFLVARGYIAATATDEQFKAEIVKRMMSGELTAKEVDTLTDDKPPDGRKLVQAMIDEAFTARGITPPTGTGTGTGTGTRGGSPTPHQLFGGGGSGSGTRSGAPSGGYSTTKSVALHRKYKTPVEVDGAPLLNPSRREAALAGSFLLYMARSAGVPGLPWNDHFQSLLDELINEGEWCGDHGGVYYENVRGGDFIRKVLADDSVSGGTELVPQVVDSVLVTESILTGELLPHVTTRPISQGRLVKIPTIGTPSIGWSAPEGTSIPIFDTTGLCSSLPCTIFPVSASIEVGRDMLEDSAPDLGSAIISIMGNAFAREADRVIALGDGVVQPLGIFNTAGTTAVSSAAGAGGPMSVGDYESLYFALSKATREQSANVALIGNDLNYQRLRTLRTGVNFNTNAMGPDISDYKVGILPYRVVNSIPNNRLACVALRKYFLYRRAGFVSRFETGGKELTLKNLALLVSRGRYGGRLVDPTAAAVMSDLAA